MNIIINIPELTYRNIKYGHFRLTEQDANNIINAIKNADNDLLNVVKLEAYEKSEAKVTETSMHHLACAMCDNEKCVRGTKECEFEQWKAKQEREDIKNA